MSKLFTAALAATALIGAGVLTQSVTTSASTDIVGTTETAAPAAVAPLVVVEKPLPSRLSALQAAAPSAGAEKCLNSSAVTPVPSTQAITQFTVPQFDSSLGELVSLAVVASVGFTTSGTVTNPNDTEANLKVRFLEGDLALSLVGPGVNLVNPDETLTILSTTVAPNSEVTFDEEAGPTITQEYSSTAGDLSDSQVAAYFYDASASEPQGTVGFTVNFVGDVSTTRPKSGAAQIDTPATASVVATYCYKSVASIGITKTIKPDTGVTTSDFTFAVSCDDGFTGTATINGAGTTVVAGMAIGSTCTVTEQTPSSGSWVAEVADVCTNVVSGVKPGETAAITNRLWGGSYDPCTPLE